MRRTFRTGLFAALLALASAPAAAHPHVWVSTAEAILYDAEGRLSAIRHDWTFDEGYSAFAVQGFETGPDGKPRPDKLADLAKLNVESLAEFDYFTSGKANGAKLVFAEPRDYALTYEGGRLTLRFVMPLKNPVPNGRSLSLSVYDPTFFVEFSLAEGPDTVRLVDPPPGCALRVDRPKPAGDARAQPLSESFFTALSGASNYGVQFSGRINVACP